MRLLISFVVLLALCSSCKTQKKIVIDTEEKKEDVEIIDYIQKNTITDFKIEYIDRIDSIFVDRETVVYIYDTEKEGNPIKAEIRSTENTTNVSVTDYHKEEMIKTIDSLRTEIDRLSKTEKTEKRNEDVFREPVISIRRSICIASIFIWIMFFFFVYKFFKNKL